MTTIFLLAMLSAPGDAQGVFKTDPVVLDGPQKTQLAGIVNSMFPEAETSTMDRQYCSRKVDGQIVDPTCTARSSKTVTSTEFLALEAAGKAGVVTNIVGDNVTFERWETPVVSSAPQKILINNFVSAVFSGLVVADIVDYNCERNPNDETEISCVARYNDTVTPIEFATLKKSGNVIELIAIEQ